MLTRRRFVRRDDGSIRLRLSDDDVATLEWLLPQLREGLLDAAGAGTGDPPEAFRRLFPVAHTDDPEAEAEYRSVMGDQLLAKRLDALDVVEATYRSKTLTAEEGDTWMGVTNDLRLVIGTVLDIGEDDDHVIDPDDPEAAMRWAYLYLTGLLSEIISARST